MTSKRNKIAGPAVRAASIIAACGLLVAFHLLAQTNVPDATNGLLAAKTSAPVITPLRAERMRAVCVQGRRCVCGRVLKILPSGVVVESGYTSLMRPELKGAWLVPGTVTASLTPSLVEGVEPGAVCVGQVFLTDLPRHRHAKINLYDYVVVNAYPAGEFTYASVGGMQRTVRRFSCGLETAVRLSLQYQDSVGDGNAPHPAGQ